MNIELINPYTIDTIISDFSKKESKIVIIDGDYISFKCSYSNKDAEKVLTLEECQQNVDNHIMELYNTIEAYFHIAGVYICLKGKNNFRKQMCINYKAKRAIPPPLIGEIHNYIVEKYNGIEATIGEADDLVYTLSLDIKHSGIIVSPDKDLLQVPSIIYSPNKNQWFKITKEQGIYNLAIQVLMGDSTDGINEFPKTGIKTAQKIIKIGMSIITMIKEMLIYTAKYDDNKNKLRKSYNLVKLYNINGFQK